MILTYQGILFLGHASEVAGRSIAGPRLRTAAKKAGFDILITDTSPYLTVEQIEDIIRVGIEHGIKFVGFSVSWIQKNLNKIVPHIDKNGIPELYQWYTLDFFAGFQQKFPSILLITGGNNPTHEHRNLILNYSNYHFDGFSDNSFCDFLRVINRKSVPLLVSQSSLNIAGKIIESDKFYPVTNPDELETEFILEDDFKEYQPIPIELSRGCIFRCAFCEHPFQGKKDYDSYQRSPQSIANELKRNYELFGTTRYTVLDDTFNDSIEKIYRLEQAIEIAKLPKFEFVAYIKPELLVTKPEMIDRMAKIGLRGAFLGIESINDKARKVIGKGMDINRVLDACQHLAEINNEQVLIHAAFIVGLPFETVDSQMEAFEKIKNMKMFRYLDFSGLMIRNLKNIRSQQVATTKSLMEIDPLKYGYSFTGDNNYWVSEHFNTDSARELAKNFMEKSKPTQKFGGWGVASAWHEGLSEDFLQNGLISNRIRDFQSKINRANDECNRLIKLLQEAK